MEVRLVFTVAEHGRLSENGERFMRAFTTAYPEGGPSVSQSVASGSLTVTFSVDADDAKDALEHGVRVFDAGVRATGLPSAEVVSVKSWSVEAERAMTIEASVLAAVEDGLL